MLKGKKVLIGITGSIAAYKIPLLIRLLKKEGAEVQCIQTPASRDFVTPLTLSTLSENPVLTEPFNSADGTWHSHIELGYWADVYLVAPVSANTMGKMVNGLADNLLVATYLAARCPVVFAPAMDVDMYNHPSTMENIRKLQSYGNLLLEPDTGELASGLTGAGRMQEPEKMLKFLKDLFQKKKDFKNKKVLVTAGPTYESIDPVRFIGNYSSGKMGLAIAEAFAGRGAEVELVCGPVGIQTASRAIRRTDVHSAKEMHERVLALAPDAEVVVMAAAVADYTPGERAAEKIKKTGETFSIHLKKTPDILKELGATKPENQFLVGFALETNNEQNNARKKLENKNLDLIVLNSLRDEGAGFTHSTNNVTFIPRHGKPENSGLKSKREIAEDLLDVIKKRMKG